MNMMMLGDNRNESIDEIEVDGEDCTQAKKKIKKQKRKSSLTRVPSKLVREV